MSTESIEFVWPIPYPTLPYPTLRTLPYSTLPTLPYPTLPYHHSATHVDEKSIIVYNL
jgi:hypothetical protein